MGFHPKPRQGTCPLHPFIGASPQEDKCLVGYPCSGSAYPFGATPQNPTRGAWLRTGKGCAAKRRAGACVPRPFNLSKESVRHRRLPPLFRSVISSKMRLRAKQLARGLGRSPKWELRAQAGITHQALVLLGRSPNKGVKGARPPSGEWGGAPHRPPQPPMGSSTFPRGIGRLAACATATRHSGESGSRTSRMSDCPIPAAGRSSIPASPPAQAPA